MELINNVAKQHYFLVNAKKDELEKNNEKVQNVLSSVQTISENLFSAGTALSDISDNESASAEELAATTEELLASSNLLDEKTNESMSNLNELKECLSDMAWKEPFLTHMRRG